MAQDVGDLLEWRSGAQQPACNAVPQDVHARNRMPRIIDAWMQRPTQRHSADPMFASLRTVKGWLRRASLTLRHISRRYIFLRHKPCKPVDNVSVICGYAQNVFNHSGIDGSCF